MASILKVDSLLDSAGNSISPANLGLNMAGTVLQVVSHNSNSLYTTSSTSWTGTDLAVTITPKFSNSMILIVIQSVLGASGAISSGQAVFRNGTQILAGQAIGGVTASSGPSVYGGSADGNNNESVVIQGKDFPNTTSPVTYDFRFRSPQSGTIRMNDLGSGIRNQTYSQTSMSNITVWEIAQ